MLTITTSAILALYDLVYQLTQLAICNLTFEARTSCLVYQFDPECALCGCAFAPFSSKAAHCLAWGHWALSQSRVEDYFDNWMKLKLLAGCQKCRSWGTFARAFAGPPFFAYSLRLTIVACSWAGLGQRRRVAFRWTRLALIEKANFSFVWPEIVWFLTP